MIGTGQASFVSRQSELVKCFAGSGEWVGADSKTGETGGARGVGAARGVGVGVEVRRLRAEWLRPPAGAGEGDCAAGW